MVKIRMRKFSRNFPQSRKFIPAKFLNWHIRLSLYPEKLIQYHMEQIPGDVEVTDGTSQKQLLPVKNTSTQPKQLQTPPLDTPSEIFKTQHFSTLLDFSRQTIRNFQNSTFIDIYRHDSTFLNISRHYSMRRKRILSRYWQGGPSTAGL